MTTARPAFLLLFALAACSLEPAGLSPAEFTRTFLERLQRDHPSIPAEIRGDLHIAVAKRGGPHDAFLEDAYAEYKAAPEDLEETLAWYVHSMVESIPDEGRETIERVLPLVREARYPEAVAKAIPKPTPETPTPELATEPINEELVVVYAFALGTGYRPIWRQEVPSLGVASAQELRRRALENLRKELPKIERTAEGLAAGRTHESSLILLDDLWTPEACPVKGEIVIAVPSRDALLVAGSEDAQGLSKMRSRVAEVAAQAGYLLSPKLFVRRGGRWVVFEQ